MEAKPETSVTDTHIQVVPQSWHVSDGSIVRMASSCRHAASPSTVSHIAFHTRFAAAS